MPDYYLTIENQNIISEKSKSKKDGIYSFRGIKYLVKSGKATHFLDRGQILESCGAFNVVVGHCTDNNDGLELLKSCIK